MPSAIAAVVPVAVRADSDLLMWALGYQPDPSAGASTYSVPLSPAGADPATHYGCNFAAIEQATIDTILAAIPEALMAPSWSDLLETSGLVRVETE